VEMASGMAVPGAIVIWVHVHDTFTQDVSSAVDAHLACTS